MPLTFANLRAANDVRIGHFKNSKGEPAHTTTDGHDWSPAQWFQATLGELGEFAQARLHFENGVTNAADYAVEASKELADIVTYLDILAKRSLDKVAPWKLGELDDDAQILMLAVSYLGIYANARKKYDRGDIDWLQFEAIKQQHLHNAIGALNLLRVGTSESKNKVTTVHPTGIDLGVAVVEKFNEVSQRVGSPVALSQDDWHIEPQR